MLPTSVDNVAATLRSDAVATLWKRGANVVATLQSRNFCKVPYSVFSRLRQLCLS